MKFITFVLTLAVAVAAPQNGYSIPAPSPIYDAPSTRADVVEVVPILRDDRVHEKDGHYSFDIESANGISVSESGSPDGPEGTIVVSGQFTYTDPMGYIIELSYVADENGFQPQGDHLPVAPEFPHPIPQYVLDQIAFAAEQDAFAAAKPRNTAPSQFYQKP